ncbi:MAG: hypothetical protein H5T86_05575 [Armatimonadetes bacterium]|nr:hypothetical protein [Armatimonadota bacterium]
MVGTPRLRRLYADYQAVRSEFAGHPYIEVKPLYGNPPEAYEVTYRVPGVVLEPGSNRPVIRNEHKVRIYLHRDYPREKPKCVMETPIFHPNIGSYICIDDYWAAGETLVDIIVHIGQMIQYQNYNPDSPLNPVAAQWARQHHHLFPVGKVDLYPPELDIELSAKSTDQQEPAEVAIDENADQSDLDIELL